MFSRQSSEAAPLKCRRSETGTATDRDTGVGLGLVAGPTSSLDTNVYRNVYNSRAGGWRDRPRREDARVAIILHSSPWGMKIYRSQAQNQPKALYLTALDSAEFCLMLRQAAN